MNQLFEDMCLVDNSHGRLVPRVIRVLFEIEFLIVVRACARLYSTVRPPSIAPTSATPIELAQATCLALRLAAGHVPQERDGAGLGQGLSTFQPSRPAPPVTITTLPANENFSGSDIIALPSNRGERRRPPRRPSWRPWPPRPSRGMPR